MLSSRLHTRMSVKYLNLINYSSHGIVLSASLIYRLNVFEDQNKKINSIFCYYFFNFEILESLYFRDRHWRQLFFHCCWWKSRGWSYQYHWPRLLTGLLTWLSLVSSLSLTYFSEYLQLSIPRNWPPEVCFICLCRAVIRRTVKRLFRI